MVDRYIGVFKKIIVLLVILFIIVCFSFGITYSNFIYNSDNHRAVQMHVNRLTYGIKINDEVKSEIELNSGINIVNVELESLNSIETYYKLIIQKNSKINAFYLDNPTCNQIKENEKVNIKLIIFNSSNDKIKTKFLVNGGYIINSKDDINVDNEYQEINRLNIGDYISYNVSNNYNIDSDYINSSETQISVSNRLFRILSINDDGSIEIVSYDPVILNNVYFKGANGYNNFNYIINDICSTVFASPNTISARNINTYDINKYLIKEIISYNSINIFYDLYVPTMAELENNIIVESKTGNLNNNDIVLIDKTNTNRFVSNVIVSKPMIKNIEPNDSIYQNILMNKEYYLSTRSMDYNDEYISWGIYKMSNSGLTNNVLYNSKNEEYIIDNVSILPIIKLNNNTKISLEDNILEIK